MNSAGAIIVDGKGFYLPGIESRHVPWPSVRCIRAFKKDLMTSDEVFLSFQNDTAPEYVEVSEEDSGFAEFRVLIEKRFSFPDGWWESVLKPAFVRNEIVLYVRTNSIQPGAPGGAPNAACP